MKVKRIFAPDMRQAMRRVRDEIGPDAVIVSNQRVSGGVEIVVAREDEYEAAQEEIRRRREAQANSPSRPQERRSAALDSELARARAEISRVKASFDNPLPESPVGRQMQPEDDDLQSILQSLRPSHQGDPLPPLHDSEAPHADDGLIVSMQHEIQQLKELLEKQLSLQATPAPVAPAPSAPSPEARAPVASAQPSSHPILLQRLKQMGLSDALCEQLMAPLEQSLEEEKAWKHVLSHLAESLPVFDDELIKRGGMIALLGPTGVGKTTTIGKLATRYVLEHGSAGVALVTTDGFRIAAHEQLKVFGRILDVPVHIADENRSLEEVLMSLRDKRLVLIDTAGMSGHDRDGQAQLEMFSKLTIRVKKLLVMSCSSQGQLLQKAYNSYQSLGLNGCILSKLDESGNLGEVLTLVLDKQLPVAYVADGQHIPDDISIAKRKDLVSQAVLVSRGRRSERAKATGSSLHRAS